LAIYGYGTNTVIRAAAAGEHGHDEDEIRYARRRHRPPCGGDRGANGTLYRIALVRMSSDQRTKDYVSR
jgi:hypothetical protein